MLDQIKTLIDQKNLSEARQALKTYLQQNPEDADAWFLAARVSPTREQAISCLKKVIDLDPFNDSAIQQLNKLTQELSSSKSTPKQKNQSLKSLAINPIYIGGGAIIILLFGLIIGVLLSSSNNDTVTDLPTIIPQNMGDNDNNLAFAQQTTETNNYIKPTLPPTWTPTRLQPTLPPTWTLTPTQRSTSTPQPTRNTRGTKDNPYPFNDGYVYGIRGSNGLISVINVEYNAWNIVESINMFNEEPSYNEQWILVGIAYKCDLPSNQTCDIYPSGEFELLGSDGKLYEPPFATVLDNLELQDTIFGGETVTGYIGFIVDRFDSGFILIAKPSMFSNERTFFRTQ